MFLRKKPKKMRTFKIYILAVGLLFTAASCAVTDVDKTTDFSKYKTFTWGKSISDADEPAYDNPLILKNIKETIEAEFAKKGIYESASHADFIINYKTHTAEKREVRSSPYAMSGPFFFPMYRYYYWGGYAPYTWNYGTRETTFKEGTLIIDIVDARTQELVWRGTVKGNVDNLNVLERQVEKGVRAILKKYPRANESSANSNPKVIS
jgi:hypothetical protein